MSPTAKHTHPRALGRKQYINSQWWKPAQYPAIGPLITNILTQSASKEHSYTCRHTYHILNTDPRLHVCIAEWRRQCVAMKNLAANTPCRRSAVFRSSMFLISMELWLGAVYAMRQSDHRQLRQFSLFERKPSSRSPLGPPAIPNRLKDK